MGTMMRSADLVVVGLGAVGSAALYQAARRGMTAIGIDQFAPPHDRGSSHGDTRITRQAIGEGNEFVPLVLRSDEIWNELESATGRNLATRCGCLVLQSPQIASNHHGAVSFIRSTVDAALQFRIAHERLSAQEVRKRFPQFVVNDEEAGYFEPGAGFLRPEACITAQLSEARRLGATIVTGEEALRIIQHPESVSVRTTGDHYAGARVILTAGPWIAKLLGHSLRSSSGTAVSSELFRVFRQTLCWFDVAGHAAQFSPECFPVFIWITGDRPRDMLYGFPAIDGASSGMKVATEQYDETTNPDRVNRDVDPREIAAMHAEYIAPRLPSVSNTCLRYKTCLYTVTPDAKFVIDRVEGCENVWFASACSGHGFKHSAALGEALVQLATGEPPRLDLSPFRMDRFAKVTGGD